MADPRHFPDKDFDNADWPKRTPDTIEEIEKGEEESEESEENR